MNMIINFIILIIIVVIIHFLKCLQWVRGRGTIIFYVDVRRGSRTCGIPVPSVFFSRNRNSFRIFHVKKEAAEQEFQQNSFPLRGHQKDKYVLQNPSGVPLDTLQHVYEVRLIIAPITEDTTPSSTAIQNPAAYLREYLCSEDTLLGFGKCCLPVCLSTQPYASLWDIWQKMYSVARIEF